MFTVNVTVPEDFYMDDMPPIEAAIIDAMINLNADDRYDTTGYDANIVYRTPQYVTNTITGNAANVIQCGNVDGGVRLGGAQ
jgi:hypothetical protein